MERDRYRPFAICAGLIILTTIFGQIVKQLLEPTNLVMFYLLIVVIAAVRWGRGPAIMSSFLGVLSFDFFLVPPYLTFNVASIHYLFTFAGLLVVGLVISTLASRMRERTIQAGMREAETAALYRLSSDLAASETSQEALLAARTNIGRVLRGRVAIYLPSDGALTLAGADEGYPAGAEESKAAKKVSETGEPLRIAAGPENGGQTLLMPLKTPQGTLGVLGVSFHESSRVLAGEEERLLEALVSQTALAVQRARLAEKERQIDLLRQTEKLHTALFSSISHDLRTPLASITGTMTALLDQNHEIGVSERRELLATARGETARLNRLVGNLLDMTKMEAGALRISKRPCDLRDLIGASLEQSRERIGARTVHISIGGDLPEVPADFTFMIKVFSNLIDNALKFSPPGSPVGISARVSDGAAEVEISDAGPGIPATDIGRIFEKFHRVERQHGIPGTGLGLSICRGIVEAHGGTIEARNNDGPGATFTVRLPMEQGREGR